MTDTITDDALDALLGAADPLALADPTPAETEQSLGRVLARADAGAGAGGALRRGLRGRLSRRLLTVTTAAVAAGTAAVTLLLGASTTTPAFAVTQHRDGSITVLINRVDGIAGANRRLIALGAGRRLWLARAMSARAAAGCVAARLPMVTVIPVPALIRARRLSRTVVLVHAARAVVHARLYVRRLTVQHALVAVPTARLSQAPRIVSAVVSPRPGRVLICPVSPPAR